MTELVDTSEVSPEGQRDFRRGWQNQNVIRDAISNVMSLFNLNPDDYPRIYRVAFVNNEMGDTEPTFVQLQRNPAMPVIVLVRSNVDGACRLNHTLAPLLRFPNVRVARDNELLTDIFSAFTKPPVPLESADTYKDGIETTRSVIRHDLRHALNGKEGYDCVQIIERARQELSLTGDDQVVIDAVMKDVARESTEQPTFDFPAVCVDWDGTLFQEGDFSQELFNRVQAEAHARSLPVVIWTGGDVDNIYRILRQRGINDVEVCSKQHCRGFVARVAIDDESPEFLRSEYGIGALEIKKPSDIITS